MLSLSNESLALYRLAANGNTQAFDFLCMLAKVCTLWDGVVDGDCEPDDGNIDVGFFNAMVGIRENEFYQKYKCILDALIGLAWSAWHDSIAMKKSGDEDLVHFGKHLARMCDEIAVFVAVKCIGVASSMKIVQQIRLVLRRER